MSPAAPPSTLPGAPPAEATRQGALAFAPEFQVLLASCSICPAGGEWLPAPETPIDWSRVLQLAEHHGALPALYEWFVVASRAAEPHIDLPREVHAEIARRFEQNVRKNLRLAAELSHVLECLESAGVDAIPHKGPFLAEHLYGDLALRDFSDLDLLVPVEQVSRAKGALARIGYRPNCALSAAEERAYFATGYEYTFDGPAGQNLLELQWNLVPRFFSVDFDMAALFARAVPRAVAGRAVRSLTDEDLLLVLCVHAAKHLWSRLCWLRDIATLAARPDLKWDLILSEAHKLGVMRILAVSLILGRDLLKLPLPEDLERTVCASPEAARIAGRIAQHIPHAEESSTETIAYVRWMLRLRERRGDRWSFAARLAATPSLGEWSWIRLPEPMFPLYRAVRFARLTGRLLRRGAR